MSSTTQLNQGTIGLFNQEFYLPIAIDAFLLDRRAQNLSPGTLVFYRVKLGLFTTFCENLIIKSVLEITPNLVRQFLFHLDNTGHNPGGIHACYRALRTFLYWFELEYELEEWKNPIRRVKAPKLENEPLEPISQSDFTAILAVCDKNRQGARDRAILLTLLDSGIRASELTALDLSALDMKDGALEVMRGKGRKPRVSFVGARTRRAIRQWLKYRGNGPGALFLAKTGTRLTYWGLREIIRRRAKQAGITEPGAHDFRRAFCLAQLQAGVPETTIARLMGHTTTQLIARYAKQNVRDLQEIYYSPIDKQ